MADAVLPDGHAPRLDFIPCHQHAELERVLASPFTTRVVLRPTRPLCQCLRSLSQPARSAVLWHGTGGC